MAASGIQEHNEARRKERVLLKKAYIMKALQDQGTDDLKRFAAQQAQTQQTQADNRGSYEEELISRRVGSPPGIGHRHRDSVDRYRRTQHLEDMKRDYSAKIPHRYSNFDYTSQW